METKHTPGPWVVVTGKNISVGPCPGQRVALCNYDNGPVEAANARLISAAPDMLAALLAISKFMPTTSAAEGGASAHSENVRAADMVRAAITKTTG